MNKMKIVPKCKSNAEHFVTCEGKWLPCCVVPTHNSFYEDSIFNSDDFQVTETNIYGFHRHPKFVQWLEDIQEEPDNAPRFCKNKCGRNIRHEVEHQK